MVKVSIRDYMPPYTTWMQVELEEGVCGASPDIRNPKGTNGEIEEQSVVSDAKETFNTGDWEYSK